MLAPPALARQTASPTAEQTTVAPEKSVRTKRTHTRGDPLEGFNRSMFSIYQTLDRVAYGPVALEYKKVVPRVLRSGLRNALSNLSEPVVFLNDLLQLKPGRAARTLTRFFVNTTIGLGGLLDVAKGENFPHRRNGLGNTLARYGVGPGPYIFFPILGPTDLRDLLGGQADGLVLPAVIGTPFDRVAYAAPVAVISGLDLRAESDVSLHALLDDAVDPYATLRSVYQQNRAAEIAEIKGGKAPAAELDDPLADPAGPTPATDTPAGDAPASDTPATPAAPSAKSSTATPSPVTP